MDPELKKIAKEKRVHNPIEIDNDKSDYPKMIIDEKLARKEAAKKIFFYTQANRA